MYIRVRSENRRRVLHGLAGLVALSLATVVETRDAVAANCMRVLGRDAYWSQFDNITRFVPRAGVLDTAFRDAEFTVDNKPVIGALMVWAPRFGGATWAGHVAIVVSVGDDDTVRVRHENWPRGAEEHFSYFEVLPGHRFVHPRRPHPGSVNYPDEIERRDLGVASSSDQLPGRSPRASELSAEREDGT